jgi:3D (Asp-Asp-Asp) domain-containing protein
MRKFLRMGLVILTLALLQSLAHIDTVVAASTVKTTKELKITDDGVTRNLITIADTVGGLLEREGIGFEYMDTLNYDFDEPLKSKMEIVITRGYYITVTVDGTRVDRVKITSGLQAGYLLKRLQEERGVTYEYSGKPSQVLREGDVVALTTPGKAAEIASQPVDASSQTAEAQALSGQLAPPELPVQQELPADTPIQQFEPIQPSANVYQPVAVIQPSDILSVAPASQAAVITQQITEFEIIPFITEIMESADLAPGETQTLREGVPGERRFTYDVSFVNGQEIQRTLASDSITLWPVSRIVYQGVSATTEGEADPEHVGIIEDPSSLIGQQLDPAQLSYKSVHNMQASAYSAESSGKSPGSRGYGITATGIKARHGVVAVDPSVIPLGTLLYVEGYGVAIAADTGGAIKGEKIDLFFESTYDARLFGRQSIRVYVLS